MIVISCSMDQDISTAAMNVSDEMMERSVTTKTRSETLSDYNYITVLVKD